MGLMNPKIQTKRLREFLCCRLAKIPHVFAAILLALLGLPTTAFADNAVQLKVLVITSGPNDLGYDYIKPILDEMGVPYDTLDASSASLTAETLSPNGCSAATAGCIGNYNGIILTLTDAGLAMAPAEWDILHAYEKDFHVRESVISGFPGTYWDPNPPWGVYLDYGQTLTSSGTYPNTQWSGSATNGTTVYEYLQTNNSLPITDFAFAAVPRNDNLVLRDGTVASVEPLLTTANGETLISIVRYYSQSDPSVPVREVLLSSITNASYLIHSQALGYEFVNFATQGVFVGGRYIYMNVHLDDLFLSNDQWDPVNNVTDPAIQARLTGHDIANAVAAQNAFRSAFATVPAQFKIEFPFNGAGAVVDPTAKKKKLAINYADDLVSAIRANKNSFRYINHTFSHADMDNPPASPGDPCDYETLPSVTAIKQQITKNRRVWKLLDLPQKRQNKRILISGNHSGLKDRNCTDIPELHPEMSNVQDDDIPYPQGANPMFFEAMASVGVDYIASDSSQLNQDVEHYITQVDDGSNTDRIMLPRYPTNIFYNVTAPDQLTDEYNYIFYERFVNNGQDPCTIPGAICTPRTYEEILAAEAETTLRHMMSFKKWAHYFHQSNAVDYGSGNTLIFDWLNAVFTEYEQLFKLPVKNYPYFRLGDMTKERLIAKSATIQAIWNRDTNEVTLSADRFVPNLLVTGLEGGDLYGGQYIRELDITTTPQSINVNRALNQ